MGMSLTTIAQEVTVDEYIDTYRDVAIQEMERSGIPASITLAQGIHESAFGNSRLAKKAKNHFGIKCASDWKGKKYFKWDDDPRKSCFRVYKSAINSYIDHTNFLVNRKRYAFLFEYDRNDYKSWAKGLRKAGYATDPKYPAKLIHTIEKYDLAKYDKATGTLAFEEDPSIEDEGLIGQGERYRTKPRSFLFRGYGAGFYKQNGSTYAIAKKGESAIAFAKRFGIPYKRLLRFNDLEDGDQLIEYQYMYIDPKKIRYKHGESFHKVERDETMYEIAQYYGVRLKPLLRRNLLEKGEEPANGELVLLKDRAVAKPKLRGRYHIDTLPPVRNKNDDDNKLTASVSDDGDPKKIIIPKIERPKPQDIEINTPTYEEGVYADSIKLNTAIVEDSSYLNIDVAEENTSSANTYNPFTTGSTTTNVNTTSDEEETGTSTSDSTQNNPYLNPNAMFGGNDNSSSNSNDNATNNDPYTNKEDNNTPTNNNSPSDINTTNVNDTNTANNTNNTSNSNANFIIHTVQKGETLYALYRKYSIKVDIIKAANNMTSNNINIGDRIKIPVK